MNVKHGCQMAQTWWLRKWDLDWDGILHPIQMLCHNNNFTLYFSVILFKSLKMLPPSKEHDIGVRGGSEKAQICVIPFMSNPLAVFFVI